MLPKVNVDNEQFVKAVFGVDHPWCHVTDFPYDPGAIPKEKHLIAWKGDYYCRYNIQSNSNQYFTISTFYCDEHQQARRRKALFRQTHCIVLDDVREKLSIDQVQKLPRPSWILETSVGSEQWGYILDTPCTDRAKVENLLDGLVANGLAPGGKDPGMKGVTRYVRLPSGVNSKASKLINGVARPCQMLLWEPFNVVSIDQLALPFMVDLDAPRREQRVDGAAAVSDHPLINIPGVIKIKEVRSDGRFDITCPWVNEHTDNDDSGSAIFTNEDGSIGFKCHHGACQHRNGNDIIKNIDDAIPGWSSDVLKNWQIMRDFEKIDEVSFMGETPQETSFIAGPTQEQVLPVDAIQMLCDDLRRQIPATKQAREAAATILKHVDDLPKIDQVHWHDLVCDIMRWSKADCKEILKDLRKLWYINSVKDSEFYDDFLFVKELNQFYEVVTRGFYTTDAFQNAFSHIDAEARKNALQEGMVRKVDRLDFAPRKPAMFQEGGVLYGNTWYDSDQPKGTPGDASPWQRHFELLGWENERKHVEQWMAYTLRYPEFKINHMLIFGSGEGCGKDWLLYPLTMGMGENAYAINGDDLTSDFDDYLLSTKYLHINETDLADHRKAMQVSNKLKPIAAAPPDRIPINQKGVKRIRVRNIVNGTMTTNSYVPLKLNGASRRFFALWSHLNTRDEQGQTRQEWLDYWNDHWKWMKNGGWEHVLWYLYNVVDLSDFKPQAPPKVTDFLKEIQEASKSPQQQTIEAFIASKTGLFQSDLLQAQDIADTIRADGVFNPNLVYCDLKYITPVGVGKIMNSGGNAVKLRGRIYGSNINVYAVRNVSKYLNMSGKEIYSQYTEQIRAAKGVAPVISLITDDLRNKALEN
jgi:hypothetical protein